MERDNKKYEAKMKIVAISYLGIILCIIYTTNKMNGCKVDIIETVGVLFGVIYWDTSMDDSESFRDYRELIIVIGIFGIRIQWW